MIAFVIAAIIFFVMAVSLCVIVVEAGHNCHGDCCPICKLITVCENNIKGISLIFVIVVTLMIALAVFRTLIGNIPKSGFKLLTPVSLKVKLTN